MSNNVSVELNGVTFETGWSYGSGPRKSHITLSFIAVDTDLNENPLIRTHHVKIFSKHLIKAFLHKPDLFIAQTKETESSWEEVYVPFPTTVPHCTMAYAGCYVLCKTHTDPETGEKLYVAGFDPQTRMTETLREINGQKGILYL